MYVKDRIGEEYKNWTAGDKVLITAPTGAGKTSFVFDSLLPYAQNQECGIIYFCNRNLLQEQIITVASEKGVTLEEDRDGFLRSDCLMICNYQRIETRCCRMDLDKQKELFNFGNVKMVYYIFDEAHYFIHDAVFNPSTNWWCDVVGGEKRYDRLTKDGVRIFLTATSEEFELFLSEITVDIISECISETDNKTLEWKRIRKNAEIEHQWLLNNAGANYFFNVVYDWPVSSYIQELKRTAAEISSHPEFCWFDDFVEQFRNKLAEKQDRTLKRIRLPSSKHDFGVRYFKEYDDIIECINCAPNEKWLIFVEDKKLGYQLEQDINKRDGDAVFIDASSKKRNANNRSAQEYQTICESNTFSCKALISTSVMDNGVSIIDPNVKHIVLAVKDKTSFLQMFGRKRWQEVDEGQVTVYLKYFSPKDIGNRAQRYYKAVPFIKSFLNLNALDFQESNTKIYDTPKLNGSYLQYRIDNIIRQTHNDSLFYALLDKKTVDYDMLKRKVLDRTLPIDVRLRDFRLNRAVLLRVISCIAQYNQVIREYHKNNDADFYLKEQLSWLGREYDETAWLDQAYQQVIYRLQCDYENRLMIPAENGGAYAKEILELLAKSHCAPRNYQPSRYKTDKYPGKAKTNYALIQANIPYRIDSKQRINPETHKKERVWYISKIEEKVTAE